MTRELNLGQQCLIIFIMVCLVAFVTYFAKLSHSFPKQCCNSQSVGVSGLDILDVRSLEGQ